MKIEIPSAMDSVKVSASKLLEKWNNEDNWAENVDSDEDEDDEESKSTAQLEI